jgi:2-phospho-L-lactate guanylyltransferase
MKCWLIIPVKRLSAAKSRLAAKLTLGQRRELVCSLLSHTLKDLEKVKGIGGKIVVGKDRAVRRIAENLGAVFVPEKPHDGLNRALARAAREAVRRGAEAIMILPADLPLVKKGDIAAALNGAGRPPFLRIAPDRAGVGTNLLLMAPPGLIRFSFGDRSYRRHITAARKAGAKIFEIRRAALAEDLDRPEDLVRVYDGVLRKSTKGTQGNLQKTRKKRKINY